jgi:hypothetical protein
MPELEQTIYEPNTREHAEWFIESTRLLVKVLEGLPDGAKVLWLDSDTYMLESVSDLFVMLDRFDMCLAHAPGHKTAPTAGKIPDAFPEFQIGVIAMENNKRVRYIWQSTYERQILGIATDQSALRSTLFFDGWAGSGEFQWCVIPAEYDFRFQFGGQVRDRVKILHGHAPNAETYEAIGGVVNKDYVEGYQIPPRLITREMIYVP